MLSACWSPTAARKDFSAGARSARAPYTCWRTSTPNKMRREPSPASSARTLRARRSRTRQYSPTHATAVTASTITAATITATATTSPATRRRLRAFRRRRRDVVRPVAAHEVVDGVVAVDRLAGVTPEAVHDVVLQLAALGVVVVHIGDLELTASGRLQRLDHREDSRVVAVHAGHRILARRLLRLLHDPRKAPIGIELRDAQVLQVLALGHLRQHHAGAARLR